MSGRGVEPNGVDVNGHRELHTFWEPPRSERSGGLQREPGGDQGAAFSWRACSAEAARIEGMTIFLITTTSTSLHDSRISRYSEDSCRSVP